MTEKHAVLFIRRSLKRLIRENTKAPQGGQQTQWRAMLKGGASARSTATKKAREYLAAITVSVPETRALPASLNGTVGELRAAANNIRLHCTVRIQSLEKLLRIAGFSCGVHHRDKTDELIDRELGMSAPEKPESTSVQRMREGARRQALYEVQKNFLRDHNEGRFAGMSAEHVAQWLRLDGTEPAPLSDDAKSLEDFNRQMDEVLARAKGGTDGTNV